MVLVALGRVSMPYSAFPSLQRRLGRLRLLSVGVSMPYSAFPSLQPSTRAGLRSREGLVSMPYSAFPSLQPGGVEGWLNRIIVSMPYSAFPSLQPGPPHSTSTYDRRFNALLGIPVVATS